MVISNSQADFYLDGNLKVFLWGMSGVGKSTIGKKLARKMNFQFIDLDHFIETVAGQSIPQIFQGKGEKYFRKLESENLKKVKNGNVVVSTGGGTPCFLDNAEYMLEQGVCVFLDSPSGLIADRLKDSKTVRPLIAGLNTKEEIHQKVDALLEARLPFYEKAHIRIVAHLSDIDLLTNAIVEWFNSRK